MTDAAEPDGESPGQDRDPLDSDLELVRATHGRLGKAWATAAVSAWSAMVIIALTVGRPELAAVQHIVQQTTGMSALPAVIPGLPPAPAPSSVPPSHGLANAPTVRDGAVTRRDGGPGAPAGAPGGSGLGAGPSAARSPAPGAGYTDPAATPSAPVTSTPPATVPPGPPTAAPPPTPPTTAAPTTVPPPTPTPAPTADPPVTPTPDPTSTFTSPAAVNCVSSAASSSSVASLLGALASCAPALAVP
jgi:hypothetical protein